MFMSHRFVNPRSIETQLKPIDRCIALLIFHQSPANIAGAVDDASSLKCHVSARVLFLHGMNPFASIAHRHDDFHHAEKATPEPC